MYAQHHPHEYSWAADPYRYVSWPRQLLNLVGCLLVVPACRYFALNTFWPATIDLLLSILLAEYCRFRNEGRRIAFRRSEGGVGGSGSGAGGQDPLLPLRPKDDVEKHALAAAASYAAAPGVRATSSCDSMAAIVGWREDPELWTKCLESYKTATGWRFLLAGIDGDDAEDQDMVEIFKKVYPEQSRIIHMDEPLGEVANAVRERELATRRKLGLAVVEEEINELAMQTCIAIARRKLEEQMDGCALSGPDGFKHLLVHQRHLHKKGIMFTSFIFTMVITDLLGLEFVWSSDSDSVVGPDSIEVTMSTMAGDPKVGGASSGLVVHNRDENVVTRLASTVYWCELYINRSLSGAAGSSDCQSGPCAAFRVAAIRPLLVPWYNQRIFGKRMITNEDRHLTSLLLLRGWGIVYAGDIMTETESPTTVSRWLRQQVRWGRAQHIESLLYPRVYILNHPFLFLSCLRREFTHIIVFFQGILYLCSEATLIPFNMTDLLVRLLALAFYNFLRNPDRQSTTAVLWMIPGLIFYNVPLPAIQIWSLITLMADTWGNSMRAGAELAKKDSLSKKWYEGGFCVGWMAIVGAILVKWCSLRIAFVALHLHSLELLASVCFALITWKFTVRDA